MNFWVAPAGLHVEMGKVADADALATIHAQGFYRGWPKSDFAAYLADPQTTPTYVAADARRRIVGFAMLRILGAECELLSVAVERKMRGKGIARALLNAAFDDLRLTPVNAMFLEVDETNAGAIGLYRSMGFKDIGTRKGYYPHADGSVAAALVMRADLG
jgi:[ribosomal protein S18]-alanine N-acetyltransferase